MEEETHNPKAGSPGEASSRRVSAGSPDWQALAHRQAMKEGGLLPWPSTPGHDQPRGSHPCKRSHNFPGLDPRAFLNLWRPAMEKGTQLPCPGSQNTIHPNGGHL